MADVVKCVCFILGLFCFLSEYNLGLVKSYVHAAEQRHPASDFSRHTLIKPRIYHGREKRQISSTKENDGGGGGHIHHLTVNLDFDGQNHILDLNLNRDLLPKGYFVKTQRHGSHLVNKPTGEDAELCHYQGKIRGIPESWAALSTCKKGLNGVVYDGKEMHYVEKASDEEDVGLEDSHYLYKHSDLVENNKTCGYEGDAHPFDHDHHIHGTNEYHRILRYKRNTEPKIRGPYNSNKSSRYVELVLVVDNKEFQEFDSNTRKVEKHCKDIANIINGLYAPLNIFIALVGVVIWTEYDEVDFSPNGDTTLTNFLHYRREKLIKDHPNDNAQLLTKNNFDNGVVGKALKGPICTFAYSGGVNTDHSPVVGLVATTVAHEMGHNFGMEHDTTECRCQEERCIMAPSSSVVPPTHWSSCSLEYLALAFEHGMDYCLRNKPEALFGSPVCGNGFVEPGEQCDCGIPEHCNNSCCNATTCMLHANASCATGACCDLSICKPKTAGTVCRSADYECDLPEYCTGHSEYCPDDVFKLNAQSCDGGSAYCYNGKCRTRTDQCKLLWGNTGKSSDEQCYKMNVKGSRHGNCGYNKMDESFVKCEDENILCGMLHCTHLNEKLEFGMESVSILSHSFINLKGSIIPCRTAIVDLGLNQVDPGLAPDGAKCDEGKMCVNQKCMSVSALLKAGPKCSNDCNGNGVCNSKGHCHCKNGYAPPFCDYPGPGGSDDSGPASDPNSHKELINGMLIFFVGVVPFFGLIAFLAYYLRHNVKLLAWKKSPPSSKSPPKSRGNTSFQPEAAKRAEDNHSLLAEDNTHNPALPTEFFGHFKGFSLTPMKNAASPTKTDPDTPIRPAPPVPAAKAEGNPPPPSTHSVRTASPKIFATPATIAIKTVKSPNLNRANTNITSKINLFNKPNNLDRAQSFKQNSLQNGINLSNNTSVAPALPPLNAGSTARPIISSPILENSTCTAKELMSPLKNAPKLPVPVRPAPEMPNVHKDNKRPLSSPDVAVNGIVPTAPQPEVEFKKPKESTINRIASFLKSNDKKPQIDKAQTNSLPRNPSMKANKFDKVDKAALRTMEISKPIPQSEIDLAVNALPVDNEETKAVVMRAQSMRDNNAKPKPNIQTFGSMRQPNGGPKRPLSIPSGVRPSVPPPPRPALPEVQEEIKAQIGWKIPGIPGYQKPTPPKDLNNKQNQYDDCLNGAPLSQSQFSTPSSDNIYAVIEETPITSPESHKITSTSGSSESVGLLGEIVSEIQNRNLESIYSTGTLNKKKAPQASPDSSETYVNTSSLYKAPESVYSNMNNGKSSASSTSSGYINPSSVNPPIINPLKNDSSALQNLQSPPTTNTTAVNFSTFKNECKPSTELAPKSYTSPFQRPAGPLASSFNKTNVNSTTKANGNNDTNKIATSQINGLITKPNISPTTKPISTTPNNTNSTTKNFTPNGINSTLNNVNSTSNNINSIQNSINSTLSGVNSTPNSTNTNSPKTALAVTKPPSPTTKTAPTKPLNRQITPPNIKTRNPSPARTVPVSPKNTPKAIKPVTNSPDLVTSCSTNKTGGNPSKPPDVLNNSVKKPATIPAKPTLLNGVAKSVPNKVNKTVNMKNTTEKKTPGEKPPISAKVTKSNSDISATNKTLTVGAKIAARQNSNVASLQQRFENKTPVSAKPVTVGKK